MIIGIFIFILSGLINFDHGGLPAAITAISKDLNIIEVQMGGLGSLVFFGLVVGSATATFVLSKFQYK